jgi:hypothetical protein
MKCNHDFERLGGRCKHCHKTAYELQWRTCPEEDQEEIIRQGLKRVRENNMHYRNGREAKNGDKIVQLEDGKISAFGVLYNAVPGNDFCNGNIAVIQSANQYACLCDCLHVEDLAKLLKEAGLDKRPAGK